VSEPIATTARLELWNFSLEDAAGFYRLNAYPEALRYTGDAAFASLAEARDFIEDYQQVYAQQGLGRWSVYRRGRAQYLGFCGLRRDSSGAVDLGFRIAPPYWGQGFATEAARAALRVGFAIDGLDEIAARAMPDNRASHRVLDKLGFEPTGEQEDPDGVWLTYRLARESFVG
jgi:RimJ/RimL family protein N-acetyltransferase